MHKKFFHYIFILIFVFSIIVIIFSINNFINRKNDKFVITADGIEIAINQYQRGHKDVLIVAPGWFMCKNSKPFVNMAKDFSNHFDVIVMNFRGHCESSGKFTFTSREYNDLNAVINYAKSKYKKVYVAGFSLGSATAIITQYKFHNADKLILVSPPVDFDKIENQFWKKEAFIPTLQKFELKTWTGIVPGKIWLNKIKPIDIIAQIPDTPMLFIAGEKDPTINIWHTIELYNNANQPKKLVIFEKSIHAEDIYLANNKRFIDVCIKWLKDN
ncbi:alpha/beta hydrolase [bacterium]|nr:alpha/beta hydrolase [bacterium]